jgi:gas vesicle protein
MTDRGKLILGIAGGAITGAVIGLLLAPEKGSDTRRNISHTTGTWVNKFGQLFTKGKRRVNEEMMRIREKKAAAQDRVDKIKQGLG